MCGLAGIFVYGSVVRPVNEGELLRMREAMVTRGPDGAGLWISKDRQVGLAHRRLAISRVPPPPALSPCQFRTGPCASSTTVKYTTTVSYVKKNCRPRVTASPPKAIPRCCCICTASMDMGWSIIFEGCMPLRYGTQGNAVCLLRAIL